jgi:hypothetical protein
MQSLVDQRRLAGSPRRHNRNNAIRSNGGLQPVVQLLQLRRTPPEVLCGLQRMAEQRCPNARRGRRLRSGREVGESDRDTLRQLLRARKGLERAHAPEMSLELLQLLNRLDNLGSFLRLADQPVLFFCGGPGCGIRQEGKNRFASLLRRIHLQPGDRPLPIATKLRWRHKPIAMRDDANDRIRFGRQFLAFGSRLATERGERTHIDGQVFQTQHGIANLFAIPY